MDDRLKWLIEIWPTLDERARRTLYDLAQSQYEWVICDRRSKLKVVNGGSNG